MSVVKALLQEHFGAEGLGDEALIDLVTDVRHFCDYMKIDVYKIFQASYQHYLHEKYPEKDKSHVRRN